MDTENWRERFGDAMMGTFAPPLAMLERGEGAHVWDVDGNRYLDFLAGIAVNALGHAHPALVDAVSRQVATLAHVSNYFASPPQLELAERLKRITGAGDAGRVFFANSGAEAIEGAIKLARLNRGDGRRRRILSLINSFHGRTMGSLSLTGRPRCARTSSRCCPASSTSTRPSRLSKRPWMTPSRPSSSSRSRERRVFWTCLRASFSALASSPLRTARC
jgi:acetylornithine/succinyldiaminopimelate/putrescine aminotransferase